MAEAKPSNMKKSKVRNQAGFTRTELAVVIIVLVVLLAMALPGLQRAHQKVARISCLSRLEQLGIAYRTFANNTGDRYHAFTSVTNGGWRELLAGTNAGAFVWTNFVAMADIVGQSTYVAACPTDERKKAKSFGRADFNDNSHVSYFVGADANDTHPQSLLAGDRNLGPGTVPDPEYGYSPKNGQGNDVIIKGPVCWSLKMHSAGNPLGSGNILLGDGSGQQTDSRSLNTQYRINATSPAKTDGTTNNQAGFRLIFP